MASADSVVASADPVTLLLLFSVGFNTESIVVCNTIRPTHDRADFHAFVFAVASNLAVVPALAIMALHAIPDVPPIGVLGIMIMALCPGGPAANFVALLSGANVSLNAVCTATEQTLTLLLVPVGLLMVMPATFSAEQIIDIPYRHLLVAVLTTVSPIGLGLLCSWRFDEVPWKRRFALRLLCGSFSLMVLLAIFSDSSPYRDASPFRTAHRIIPPWRTVAAGALFGALVVAWGGLAGLLLPGQPFANRNSLLLEICVRDLTISLPIAMLGLPMMSLGDRMAVTAAQLTVFPMTNLCASALAVGRLALRTWRTRRKGARLLL